MDGHQGGRGTSLPNADGTHAGAVGEIDEEFLTIDPTPRETTFRQRSRQRLQVTVAQPDRSTEGLFCEEFSE